MNNTNQVHPIEFFLACLINLIEFTCYIINEIAGHHTTTTKSATELASATPTATTTQPTVQTTAPAFTLTSTKPIQHPLFDQFQALTVKQLRHMTGVTNSRVLKQQLIAIAIS